MNIALIDYNMGNLGSVANALRTVGAEFEIISTAAEMRRFDACILPGVGSFGDGMENLNRSGMVPEIRRHIGENRPFLGICLGMQMLLESSEESPGVAGIGIFPGSVKRFPASDLKVPQINWNIAAFEKSSPLGKDLPEESWFYFVHSYYVPLASFSIARAEYGMSFSAAIGQGNCFATQFHPEKSQNCGLTLLKNFAGLAARKGEGA